MADLYVCPRCGETEDCSCDDLDEACREVGAAREKVARRLGELLVVLVKRMPATCKGCAVGEVKDFCPICSAVHYAKHKVKEAEKAMGRT